MTQLFVQIIGLQNVTSGIFTRYFFKGLLFFTKTKTHLITAIFLIQLLFSVTHQSPL